MLILQANNVKNYLQNNSNIYPYSKIQFFHGDKLIYENAVFTYDYSFTQHNTDGSDNYDLPNNKFFNNLEFTIIGSIPIPLVDAYYYLKPIQFIIIKDKMSTNTITLSNIVIRDMDIDINPNTTISSFSVSYSGYKSQYKYIENAVEKGNLKEISIQGE